MIQEPKPSVFPVTLYQNVYRTRAGVLVWYQQYHESLESAKKTFNKQSNGDEPVYTIEIQTVAHL